MRFETASPRWRVVFEQEERSFGAFSRSFSLPSDADQGHIDARFDDGVLTVAIRKAEAAKPKTVDIKS